VLDKDLVDEALIEVLLDADLVELLIDADMVETLLDVDLVEVLLDVDLVGILLEETLTETLLEILDVLADDVELVVIHLQAFLTAGTFRSGMGESCRSLCQAISREE
jgi:hypothetical protein